MANNLSSSSSRFFPHTKGKGVSPYKLCIFHVSHFLSCDLPVPVQMYCLLGSNLMFTFSGKGLPIFMSYLVRSYQSH